MPYFISLGVSAIWDGSEAFYAETPREMLESGDWLSPRFNYEPRVNKPPLTYWAVAVSYKIFGVNEFAVRLPGALAVLGITLFAYGAVRSFYGPRAALFAAVITAVTPRIFILGRRLPIDIMLLLFLTGTLFFLLRATTKENAIDWRLAYVFAALGFMTKGPVAVIIPAGALLAWMLCSGKFRELFSTMRFLEGIGIFLCISFPWYFLSYLTHGWDYIASFFLSDNLGRFASESFGPSRGFFYYIPVWFLDFFPWSIIGLVALTSFRKGFRKRLEDAPFGLTFFWCALVFLMFSLSKNKQEYYIAPMYPAAAILIAGFLDKLGRHDRTDAAPDPAQVEHGGIRLLKWIYWILAFLMLLIAFILPYILDILMSDISFLLRLGPSLVLIAGVGLTCWKAFLKKFHGAFASLAFSLWIIFFFGALIYIPALENFRPVKDLCATIENMISTDADTDGETEAGYFRLSTSFNSMAFYLKRRVFEEDDYSLMLQRFQSDGRVFCIVDDRAYDWFENQITQENQNSQSNQIDQIYTDTKLYIFDRRTANFSIRLDRFFADEKRSGRELLLLSNRPSGLIETLKK